MNWTIYGVECVGILILFTCLIMIPLCRNPVWWIHDYPKDIQEKYFESHARIPTQMFSIPVLLKKGFAVLLVDWYDCFFLDWVLFANVKRIRLPGTEHMDKAYHQKKYHFVRSLIGMMIGLIPCGLAGVLVMVVQ